MGNCKGSMTEDIKVDDVLEYLSDWKTTKDVREKFNLSNSQWHHLKRWLIKGKFIEHCKGNIINTKTNRTIVYKRLQ